MASAIICLANNHKFHISKYILANMVKNLEGGVKFFMFPRFLQVFLDKQVEGMSKHKYTFVVSSHTKKIFANIRRQADGFSRDVTPLFETMMVQATEEVGADSDHPIDQPSTSSKPQKKQKPRRKQRKEVESPQDESEHEDNVPTSSYDPQPSGEDSVQQTDLMALCTQSQQQVLDLHEAKTAQAKEIAKLKKRVKKLERKRRSRPTGLRRLRKVGAATRVESPKDKDSLGDQEDSSKQGMNIEDIDQDENLTLIDEAQEQLNDEEMFGVDDLHGEIVTTAEVTTVSVQTTTIKELTLAQTLIEIKAAKPKTITAVTTDATSVTTAAITRPKAMGILAKKLNEEMQAEIAEEERVRRQKEEEANLALIELWENKRAMMEADRLLAKRLQSREREELTIE
ncbi:hypothetical protein Tco_0405445 [Tanacetum coccineum]